MKKLLLATLCILICGLAFAQAPQKMSYQAVIRDNSGNLVTNQQISMRISILKETVIGSIGQPSEGRSRAGERESLLTDQTNNVEIYIETHSATTNANGLISIEIGAGNATMGSFQTIDWSDGLYFIKTDVDLNGGTRFKTIGTSQLISVPYAMYAQKAGSAVSETDPQFNAWDKDYNDLTNRPEIPVVPTNVSAFTNDANYITSADVPAQVNADWNATSGAGQILNKPAIPTVPTNVSAFTNDANYITSADVPAQVNADWNATSGAGQILNKPELFSGNYNDLTNKPTIPTVPTNVSAFTNDANYITSADVPAQVNVDWNATSGAGQILNKPELFSGNYNDLTNKPTIPTVPTNVSAFTNDANYITSADVPAQVNADWNATSGAGQILNKPELFSGNYNDLTNKPAIPTVPTNVSAFTNDANYITSADVPAQVNADWNATSGAGQILNKPELFSGNYNDLANRPEIPTVPTVVSAFDNDANYITTESQTLADAAALGNSVNAQLKNVVDPTENQDAVTKKYVDELIAHFQIEFTAFQSEIATLQATIDSLSLVVMLGGHAFVDLGLPSSTLWATCNVGANIPEEYGDYFAWGETTAKDTYDWSTYRYCNGSNTTLTKYCYDANYGNNGFTDNLTTLQSIDDAATANWGNGWRMPTSTEMQELIDNCTFEWTTQNGVNGGKFTGPNGNSIFMPAAGFHNGVEVVNVGNRGNYGSASLCMEQTDWNIVLSFGSVSLIAQISGDRSRRYGQPVRPVYNPNDIGGGATDPSTQTTYTVTFDANGGTGTMQPQTFTAGTAQTLTANTFTKENNDFTGWNTVADGSGTAYADGQSITVSESMTLYAQWEESRFGSFIDTRDGNEYATVKIGEQTWMAENLRYVGNVSMGIMASSAVAYRYYPFNNASNVSTYGYLYNWTAAMNGSSSSSVNPSGVQGICPNGWHLPSSDEWTQLRDALDNTDVGSKLAGSAELWASGALNENSSFGTSGFNALPSGTYQSNQYYYFGEATNFWSATENDSDNALGRSLRYNSTASSVLMGGKQQGYSIRCVRND